MSEEQVLERLMLMEQWKDSGDICTREELEAIGILIDLYKKKSKMVDLMAERIKEDLKLEYGITDRNIEQIKKHYEERCK